jgi:hypothetical protein
VNHHPSVVRGAAGRPPAPRFRAIRVRGVASTRRVEGTSDKPGGIDDEATEDDDDFFAMTRRRRTTTDASKSSTSAPTDGSIASRTTSYVVRVFARVEGLEKQAIATHGGAPSGAGDADGADADAGAFYERGEACASACRSACERATASANAEEACEMCSAACEDACERRADASGKFEVFLAAGSREAEAWERDLAERRADATRRESAAVLGGGMGGDADDDADDDGGS